MGNMQVAVLAYLRADVDVIRAAAFETRTASAPRRAAHGHTRRALLAVRSRGGSLAASRPAAAGIALSPRSSLGRTRSRRPGDASALAASPARPNR
jgi:hypothetical protein